MSDMNDKDKAKVLLPLLMSMSALPLMAAPAQIRRAVSSKDAHEERLKRKEEKRRKYLSNKKPDGIED